MQRLWNPFRWMSRVIFSAANKFWWDDCFSRASSLAYTTLFALVPVTALSFAVFSGFLSEEETKNVLRKILEQILPPDENVLLEQLKEDVFTNLQSLGKVVRALGGASLAILLFVGIALLNTIESALNVLWRVTSDKAILSKIANFWAVISLGPLLIAVSLYYYTRFEILADLGTETASLASIVVPLAAVWIALTLLFYRLPAASVALKDAALGALVGAALFELVKRGFGYYVSISTTYSTFYGVLATIPLFLFWLYLIWVVVLFGAEVSYQAGSIKLLSSLRKYATELGEVGALVGLRILYVIAKRFIQGDAPPTEAEITLETGSDPVLVRTCLEVLSETDLVTVVDPDTRSRTLVVSPEKLTIGDVIQAYHSNWYRKREDSGTEEKDINSFLETIRKASITLPHDRAALDWTLAEFVSANGD